MKYVLRRVLFLLVTAWAALTINFILPRLMPGNPAEVMIAKFQGRLTPQAIHALEIAFGINVHQSLWAQYVDYFRRILTGDFGVSVSYFPATVSQVLGQAIPWTVGLVGVTTVIAFAVGTLLGIGSAWKRNTLAGDAVVPVALFLNSIPYFWLGLLVLYLFGFVLGWFPISNAYDTSTQLSGLALAASILYHAVLPAVTIIISAAGGWLLTMRNNMVSVLSEDYIAFAHAKGLPPRQVEYRYAARNAILPSFTGFAMAIGFVIGGALLTEIIFSYPGVGYLLYQAVQSLDYPLMQAIFLFITVAVLVANFVMDLLYVFLDPRVRTGGE
ncbi:MAG: ABC transporter permease [Firmicutes bacterium]|nr:ABC transporter permease [Bacillota bacterium]